MKAGRADTAPVTVTAGKMKTGRADTAPVTVITEVR